ncbi:hypothetical protein [Rhizobium sp. MHM7A]|uniref:hypothetical protein n=1 Tax=Rhizobium sp. MHM7A TaxID=2583233 RepID=UPI0011069B0A|nr:hypothetical protein [Rhizobium sp. MHM7A]TLX16586.1 hypothetical protein FFR93_04400 [Rhizobium sp. MHM7A]
MAKAKIRQSPGQGSKIDTFHFDVQQVIGEVSDGEGNSKDRILQRKVSFDLFMVKRFDESTDLPPPAAVTDVSFRLFCEETKDEVFGSDVSVMLKDMRSRLDKRFRITWKPWFLVKIDPARIYEGSGSGLTISWEDIERGEAYDGSVLMRRWDRYAQLHSSHWKVSTWPKNFIEKNKMLAAIEATPENRAALELARDQIDELRRVLVERVGPKFIEQTLRTLMGGGNFLLQHHADDE